MPFYALTPGIACNALRKAGLECDPTRVRVEARDQRWVVHLPGQRLAWFSASDEGRRRLVNERRVLRLLETRCTFGVPRVVFEDAAGEFDIRTMVLGGNDPDQMIARVRDSAELSMSLGAAVGAILAQQHTRVSAADAADWLPHRPNWPESPQWILERLVRVVEDRKLIADAEELMAAYEAVQVAEADKVLVHTDVGFHNLGIDPETYMVHGLFDYDDAAWADRHHDFRNLLLGSGRDELLNAAVSAYEPIVGRTIQRERVLLYNAACALTYLAYRDGRRPEERWCGRTLEEDLRWSREAIDRALPS